MKNEELNNQIKMLKTMKYKIITADTQKGKIIIKYPETAHAFDYIPISVQLEPLSNNSHDMSFVIEIDNLKLMEKITETKPIKIIDIGIFAPNIFRPLLFGDNWTQKEAKQTDEEIIIPDSISFRNEVISISLDTKDTISFQIEILWGKSDYENRFYNSVCTFCQQDTTERLHVLNWTNYYPKIDYFVGYPLLATIFSRDSETKLIALDNYNNKTLTIGNATAFKNFVDIDYMLKLFEEKWQYTPQKLLLKWEDYNPTPEDSVFDFTFCETFLNKSVVKSQESGNSNLYKINIINQCDALKNMHKTIYLRWVDACGCPRYYLFHEVSETFELIGNNSKTLLKSSDDYHNNNDSDDSEFSQTWKYHTETTGQIRQTKKTLKIVAPLIDKQTRRTLSSIFLSPFIDMFVTYDKNNYPCWQRIQISNDSMLISNDEIDDFELQISYQSSMIF